MVRWLIGLLVIYLLIDHLWVHYGASFWERYREEYAESLKKYNPDYNPPPIQQTEKQSIIDKLVEKVRSFIKKEKDGGEKNE
ncbi:hypothetical protein Thal_0285 [Thermocrinis albus DSM 14484]|uniref:Uncharacterized protein n=1 Tax=Thermocrinis albus (strain DSM 14484 / JCM 11386 / HI 11/12) TaxID=638303 RepID=D3SP33_THEAH|nr:hypothetical protein [Thermocrinis albus]ADC88920.1 hypothetical protein Thal_0285 [Thermocrinis albus DSM 14484]